MTEIAENTPSPEAFERIRRERDEFKGKIGELESVVKDATAALADVQLRDRAYQHLAGKGVNDPYGVAQTLAPQVREVSEEQFAETLDGRYAEMQRLFGGGEPGGSAEPTEKVAPVAPMTQPNPVAPGAPPVGGAPLVVGSPEYEARFGRMSIAEQNAAVKRGEAVFTADVAAAQSSLGG